MISYAIEKELSVTEFIHVLQQSTLAERRPVEDTARIQRMLDNASLIVVARKGHQIVGVARAVTDFAFCCYLSDLAVDQHYQKQGIGKRLIEETKKAAGPDTKLILLAAPKAKSYYPHIGMQLLDNAFIYSQQIL